MSKPCPCGASKTIKGCAPCYRENQRLKNSRNYWTNIAPLRSRKRGRPAQGEPRGILNAAAADFLRRPLRANV